MINPSTSYTIPFVTMAAGVPTNAASTPTAVVWRNGSAEATSVTVSTTSNTGIYHAVFTTGSGWAKTDRIWLVVSATISGVARGGIVWDSFSEPDAVMRGTDGANTTTPPTAAAIADAAWDEPYNQHTTAGTFGKLMDILRKSNNAIEATITSNVTPTASTFSVSLTTYPTGAFANSVLMMIDGNRIDQNAPVLSFTNNTTFSTIVLESPLTGAPAVGDTILIDAISHVHSVAEIVAGVWSALTSGLSVVGSTGRALARLIGLVQDVGGDEFTAKALNKAPSGSSTVEVLPALGVAAGRGDQTSLVAFVGETVTTSITVYQSDGTTAYNLSGKTLAIIFENPKTGDDVAVVNSGSITISGASSNVVTFAYPSAATSAQRELVWTMRDAAAPKTVYLRGMLEVRSAPVVDA